MPIEPMHFNSLPDQLPTIDVCFLDSGVGGLAYLDHFLVRNPHLTTAYIADTKHFPYGPKLPEELRSILVSVMERFFSMVECSMVVLACNTASIVGLEGLRDRFPQKTFIGTVPAVKPAVLSSLNKSIGVLGTTTTVKDQYIFQLARTHGPDCQIHVEPADDLVNLVEESTTQDLFEPEVQLPILEKILEPYIRRFRSRGVDQIVLGCTHFLHLTNQFSRLLGDEFNFQDSRSGITNRVEYLLRSSGSSEGKTDSTPGTQPSSHSQLFTGTQPAVRYLLLTDPGRLSPLLRERLDGAHWRLLPLDVPIKDLGHG